MVEEVKNVPEHTRSKPTRATRPIGPRSGADPEAEAPSDGLRSNAFLEEAMRRWGSTVLRLALSQLRSPADAEDVFQDVFLRLLKDRTAFRDDEHLKAWLLRVTVNRCHDLQRSGKRRPCEPLEGHDASIEAPDLFESDVWELVGQLPDDLRAVVHLHYVEGYATKEIARIVDCPPATVRTRLHRAREALKKALADPAEPGGLSEARTEIPPLPSLGKEASHELRSRKRLRCENAASESVRPPA